MNIVFGKMVRSFSGYFVPDSQVTKDMFKAAVNRNAYTMPLAILQTEAD